MLHFHTVLLALHNSANNCTLLSVNGEMDHGNGHRRNIHCENGSVDPEEDQSLIIQCLSGIPSPKVCTKYYFFTFQCKIFFCTFKIMSSNFVAFHSMHDCFSTLNFMTVTICFFVCFEFIAYLKLQCSDIAYVGILEFNFCLRSKNYILLSSYYSSYCLRGFYS